MSKYATFLEVAWTTAKIASTATKVLDFRNVNISLVLKRNLPSGGYFQVTSEGAKKQLYRETSSEINVESEPKMAPDAETLEVVD